jgi:hypothetical protein
MEASNRDRFVHLSRAVAAAVGVLFLSAAVVGPHWKGNLIVSPKDQFLAVVIGVLLAAAAVRGPRFVRAYTAAAVVLLNTLILGCALEFGSSLIDRLTDDDEPEREINNAVLAARPAQLQHAAEYNESAPKQLEPYVLWRQKPYSGRSITITAAGLRDTPGSHCGGDAYKVFTFGGSAMWGVGAADSETIPAFLRAMLEEVGRPVCVTNYAQIGYVFGQNVTELIDLLMQGERPDLVISYDGHNDVYVAFEQGLAHRQFYFDGLKKIFEPEASHWYQDLSLYWRVNPPPPESWQWHDYSTMGKNADALSAEIANQYFNSYSVVEALAAKWGFDFALFVQPTISLSRKRLTDAERPVMKDAQDPQPLPPLMAATYGRLEKGALERKRLFYIADVFDDTVGEIWFDAVHVAPEGNKVVATRIATTLAKARIYPRAERHPDESAHLSGS